MSKFLNKYIVAIAIFYIFWIGVLPFLLTKSALLVCKNLSANTNYKIELINPKIRLYLLPVVKIKADKINIKSKLNSDYAVFENMAMKLRFLPLISGKMHINNIRASAINVSYKSEKAISLENLNLKSLKSEKVVIDSFKTDKFNLDLKLNGKNILYNGNDLLFVLRHHYLKLKLESVLKVENHSSIVNLNLYLPKSNEINKTIFDAEIQNFDISQLSEYIRKLDTDILSVTGILNFSSVKGALTSSLKGFEIKSKTDNRSIKFPNEISLKSDFEITKDAINIKSANIDSKNVHVIANGKITDYMSKSASDVDLNIVINKSKIEDFINMLPAFRVEEIDTYKLKQYKSYGDVLGNIKIRGRLPEPELFGDVFADNVILIKPIPNTNKGATVKLSFKGNTAHYDISVPAGNQQKVWVEGWQELYNIKYAELTVKSTDRVSLNSAQNVVVPLSEILNFIIGPLPILNVYDGVGNIDITVKGNRKNPHVWGNLNFINSSVYFKEMQDLKLTGADAVLAFNNKLAKFTTQKGTVNGKDFIINGNCSLDGNFDFNVISKNQPTNLIYKALMNSTMLPEIIHSLPKFDKIIGVSDITLKIKGHVKDIKDFKISKNVFVTGDTFVKNNDITLGGITSNKTNAKIQLDTFNINSEANGLINGEMFNVTAKIKDNVADINFKIPKLNPNFLLEENGSHAYILPFVSVEGMYKGVLDKIQYDKLKLQAFVIESHPKSNIKFNSGSLLLSDGRLDIKNLNLVAYDETNRFVTSIKADNIFTKNPDIKGNFLLKVSDLKILNKIFAEKVLPNNIQEVLKTIEFTKGAIDISGRIHNNKIYTSGDLEGIELNYIPFELPVKILSGKVQVAGETVKLSNINILSENMPVFLKGDIRDIFGSKRFDLYVNSKLKQEFADKCINKNTIYPVKIKGDVMLTSQLKGVAENYDVKTNVNLSKEASMYYYGATVGDLDDDVSISLDANIKNSKDFKIKDFVADKLTETNGKKTKLNMLRIKGGAEIQNDDILLNDFRIKTSNPTDARIFNIIFRKPNIKQGKFTSDLKIYGKLSNPKIIGNFHIVETNIPFLDTVMKNIEFVFKDKTIEISSKGEVFGNNVEADAILVNSLVPPYHIKQAKIYTNTMDLNRFVERIKSAEADNKVKQDTFENFDTKSLIADSLKMKADSVTLSNIHATNFSAESSLSKDRVFDINHFVFNIAQGELQGNYRYNLKTNDININLDAQNIDANDITRALFDLNNQIYGDLTGKISLSCNGWAYENCLKTLNGNTIFNVKNGRMPKLGSLEYLLKAGNLVKGGITNLSINGVIDLITPLKTGEFSDIFGSITIRDGIANNIEITTQGKNMSLFIGGTYDFSTFTAEMEVLGLISKKISTMFGPVGNLSVNTLFNMIPGIDLSKDNSVLEKINKIPGIEISGKAYRKFIAEIKGNINNDNYVTNFNWIN